MIKQVSPIQAIGVSKVIAGRSVLREIDLKLAAGECVALMGSNGAGKTTLLRCLAALSRPTMGEVRWFGQPAAQAAQLRRSIGIVGHQTGLYQHLTVRENLLFAARMSAIADPRSRVDTMLEQVDLRTSAEQRVRRVSRGTQQRLALARALIHQPQIVLLDEPFSGLDSAGRGWLAAQLRDLRANGCAVCMATHDEGQAWQSADRTLLLHQGRLVDDQVAADTPGETRLWRESA